MAVFENRFPTLAPHAVSSGEEFYVPMRSGVGACEVVVFTQNPATSLGQLPLWQVELLIEVWAERCKELGASQDIHYVMPFENRGVEMGVTLNHPHGQIYAYPFIPPVAARELELQRAHYEKHGRGLMEDIIKNEISDGRRMIVSNADAVAFVPVCARYPYETWIAPKRPLPSLSALSSPERSALARALKTVLLKFDGLWKRPFPYLMVVHQAPTDERAYPEAHVHFQIYPALRAPGRLKYLAGTELGAGMFANDAIPEAKAEELKAVEVSLEEG